jgi:hypothetical protein
MKELLLSQIRFILLGMFLMLLIAVSIYFATSVDSELSLVVSIGLAFICAAAWVKSF